MVIRPAQPAPIHEDRFLVLRAGRELFVRRLTEIIRQCGMGIPSALAAFAREVGEAYDQLAVPSGSAEDFDRDTDITASRLTLMGDDDLEIDICIRDICIRLREEAGRDLRRSQLRYMTLLARPEMHEASNPVSPEVICLGLWAICRSCGGGLEHTLALLDGLERGIRYRLPGLYGEMDELLASYGVQPAHSREASGRAEAGAPAAQQTSTSRPADTLTTLQQAVSERMLGPRQFTADGGARSANPALDAAAMIRRKHLFERLSALDARSLSATREGIPAHLPPRPPLAALRAKDLDLPAGAPEAITLDTMVLIFAALFDSEDLPDLIKAALGSLQIPLLKLALSDPTLFASDQHPARLLVNRLGRAAVGLPRNAGTEHPVCQRLCRLTAAVRDTLIQPDATLGTQLAALDALIDEREQAIRQAAEADVQLVRAQENRQYATRLSETWLRSLLARTRSPAIASFLEQYWLRVMIGAAAEGGTHGSLWQQHSATADDLVWSVLPKQTGEERKRLAGMASSLLRRIGVGLDAIGVSAAERSPFLNMLFDLQTAALRGQAASPVAPPPAPPITPTQSTHPGPDTRSGSIVLERDGRQVRYLHLPADPRSPQTGSAGAWRVGDWLTFHLPELGALCGLCCWQSPSSPTALLANPDWSYSVAVPCALLDQQLQAGRAQITSRIALFDAAAERALSRLDPS